MIVRRRDVVGLVCVCMLLWPAWGASVAGEQVYVTYRVLDKAGEPVPNAKVLLVAVDEDGRPYGPRYTWHTGILTDTTGFGQLGMVGMPERKPGKVQIVGAHPSIGEVRLTAEWSSLIHEEPIRTSTQPMFTLQAKDGPGLRAWRQSVTKKAPALVESLMTAKDAGEIESLTRQLVAGEVMSVPALVTALGDYGNPRRRLLVDAFMRTWGTCGGRGPIGQVERAKAYSIYLVHSYVDVLREKPRSEQPFLQRYDRTTLGEMAWVIGDLPSQIAAAEKVGNVGEAQALKEILSKMEGHMKQMEAMPTTQPSSTSRPQ